jgi:peptide/nickel transport system permease protein
MAVATSTADKKAGPSRLQQMWKGISIVFESRVATIGLAMVVFWILVGIISLFWTPYFPNATDFIQNQPPNATNWLGTDHLGRDILSRLMQGTQVILLKTRLPWGFSIPGGVAIWGVFGSLLLGSILGLNAGYRGGWADQVIMQVLDALIAFPRIVLYLVVISADWPAVLR